MTSEYVMSISNMPGRILLLLGMKGTGLPKSDGNLHSGVWSTRH